MRIAFDVDGTLIKKDFESRDIPRHDVIDLLRTFDELGGNTIWVWSGGGVDYAGQWVKKLGLTDCVHGILSKDDYHNIDISVDDEDVELATYNIRV